MLNFNSILLFSEKPEALSLFYRRVFDTDPLWEEGDYTSFQVGNGVITIGRHDKVQGRNPQPERLLVNYETEDVEGEFERIKALGAHIIKEPYNPMDEGDMMIATFADPDGNLFQLVTPISM